MSTGRGNKGGRGTQRGGLRRPNTTSGSSNDRVQLQVSQERTASPREQDRDSYDVRYAELENDSDFRESQFDLPMPIRQISALGQQREQNAPDVERQDVNDTDRIENNEREPTGDGQHHDRGLDDNQFIQGTQDAINHEIFINNEAEALREQLDIGGTVQIQMDQIYRQEGNQQNDRQTAHPNIFTEEFNGIMKFQFADLIGMETCKYVPEECVEMWATIIIFTWEAWMKSQTEYQKWASIKWIYGLSQILFAVPLARGDSKRPFTDKIKTLVKWRMHQFIGGNYQKLLDHWVILRAKYATKWQRDDAKFKKEQNQYRTPAQKQKDALKRVVDRERKGADLIINEGEFRKGTNVITGNGIANTREENVRAALRNMHPEGPMIYELQGQPEDEHARFEQEIQVTVEDVIAAAEHLRDLKKDVGPRGYRPDFIRALVDRTGKPGDETYRKALKAIAEMTQEFINRRIGTSVRAHFAAGKEIAPYKTQQQADVRPIKVEDADYKLFSHVANKLIVESLALKIGRNVQFGGNTPNGPQLLALTTQIYIDKAKHENLPCTVVNFDVQQAYQNFSHQGVIEAIDSYATEHHDNTETQQQCRDAKCIFLAFFNIQPVIHVQGAQGLEVLCKVQTGGAQGNPLTSAFFRILYTMIIKRTMAEIANCSSLITVMAYEDDATSFGDGRTIAYQFWPRLQANGEPYGLKFKEEKNQAYSTEQEIEALGELDARRTNGITTCGIPVGDEEYIVEEMRKTGEDMSRHGRRVAKVIMERSKMATLPYIRMSLQNKAEYMMRGVPAHLIDKAGLAETMDQTIIDILNEVIEQDFISSDPDVQPGRNGYYRTANFNQLRIGLQTKQGGMGIRWHVNRPSYLVGLKSMFNYLARHPQIYPGMNSIVQTTADRDDVRWQGLIQMEQSSTVAKGFIFACDAIVKFAQQAVERIRKYDDTFDPQTFQPLSDLLNITKENFGSGMTASTNDMKLAMERTMEMVVKTSVNGMDRDDMRGISYSVTSNSKMSQTLMNWSCPAYIDFSDSQCVEALCNYFGLKSPTSVRMKTFTISKRGQEENLQQGGVNGNNSGGRRNIRVPIGDEYGHVIKAYMWANGSQNKTMHDRITYLLIAKLGGAGIRCLGAKADTAKNLIKHLISTNFAGDDHQLVQGFIPDGHFDSSVLNTMEKLKGNIFYARKIIFDLKTKAAGKTYLDNFKHDAVMDAVNQREREVTRQYLTHAKKIDAKYNQGLITEGGIGPVERELNNVYKGAIGLVIGPFGEISKNVEQLLTFIVEYTASLKAVERNEAAKNKFRNWIKQSIWTQVGHLIHREWAEILISKSNVIRTEESRE